MEPWGSPKSTSLPPNCAELASFWPASLPIPRLIVNSSASMTCTTPSPTPAVQWSPQSRCHYYMTPSPTSTDIQSTLWAKPLVSIPLLPTTYRNCHMPCPATPPAPMPFPNLTTMHSNNIRQHRAALLPSWELSQIHPVEKRPPSGELRSHMYFLLRTMRLAPRLELSF